MTVPERSTDVRWGLGDAALGWVLAQIGGAVAVAIVLAVNSDTTDLEDLSLAWVAVAQLGLWFGMLGVPLVASKLKGNGPVRGERHRAGKTANASARTGTLWT